MHWSFTIALTVALGSSTAAADPWVDDVQPVESVSLSHQLKEKMTIFSDEVGLRLSEVTVNLMDLRYDAFTNQAKFHLGGGDPERFALRLDSDVQFSGGSARVQSRLQLGVAGHSLDVEVPDFEVVPRSEKGERFVEVRVPLIYTRF